MGRNSQSGQKPPKWNFVTDVLREKLLAASAGKKEGSIYIFRGIGKAGGTYPSARTAREFWANPALRGKALQTIQACAERHSAAAVATLFCPRRMGEHFPGYEGFSLDDKATAALTFALFHPNSGPDTTASA